jgi:hypothetical protein
MLLEEAIAQGANPDDVDVAISTAEHNNASYEETVHQIKIKTGVDVGY